MKKKQKERCLVENYNESSKSGKFLTFRNLDLTSFERRLINHLTPSAIKKLKLEQFVSCRHFIF